MKKHPTLTLPTKSQYDLTGNLVKGRSYFKDLDLHEHAILVFLSTTCHSTDLTKVPYYSDNWVSDNTFIHRDTVAKRRESLVAKGYLKELGKNEFQLNIKGFERVWNGEYVIEKSKPTKGKVENLKVSAESTTNKPTIKSKPSVTPSKPVEQTKATVTPVTSSKPAEDTQTEIEKARAADRQFLEEYNRVMGTDHRYNIHGVWDDSTKANISYDELRQQLKLKEAI